MMSAAAISVPSRVSLAALALAGCAAMDGDFTAARQSWRGATYDEVVKAWGVPSRSERDWHTWLTYDDVPQAERAAGGVGGVVFGAPPGTTVKVTRCDRTLAFRDGRVWDENWVGDTEFCKRFARRAR
jgi:hypothetical protein